MLKTVRQSWLGRVISAVVIPLLVAGCAAGDDDVTDTDIGTAMQVSSRDIAAGQTIPTRFTCDGEDVRPSITWSGVPDDTAGIAVVMDDPDAPRGTFVHWTVWGLDAADSPLAGGSLPEGAVEGTTDFGAVGYRGPCPPKGNDPHRYRFRVFALGAPLALKPGAATDAVMSAVEEHALAEGVLEATYGR